MPHSTPGGAEFSILRRAAYSRLERPFGRRYPAVPPAVASETLPGGPAYSLRLVVHRIKRAPEERAYAEENCVVCGRGCRFCAARVGPDGGRDHRQEHCGSLRRSETARGEIHPPYGPRRGRPRDGGADDAGDQA